jgi:hypothetical protein
MRIFLLSLLMASSLLAAGPFDKTPVGRKLWTAQTADDGRGGAGIAVFDSTHVSVRNPACLTSGRLTRFQIAFSGTRSALASPSDEQITSGGHFDAWSLAFPLLYKDLSMGLNLRPLTRMESHSATSELDSQDRPYVNSTNGSGGLSCASLTLAKPLPKLNLRVGLEVALLFGSILDDWKVFYPEAAPPYDSWIERRQSYLGLQTRLGLQLKANPSLSFGLVYQPAHKADRDVVVQNRGNNTEGSISSNTVDFPTELGLGLVYKRFGVHWLLDLEWTDSYDTALGLSAEAVRSSSSSVALGLELPLLKRFDAPVYRRMAWRAGLRVMQQPIRYEVNGRFEDLQETVFTLGLGLPLKAHGTWLDLALEFGTKGTESTHELSENWLGVRASLTARDLWFWRPSYK